MKRRGKPLGEKVWPLKNKRLRSLSQEARQEIMGLIEEDVSGCIRNNGFEDRICISLAEEMEDLMEYWGVY